MAIEVSDKSELGILAQMHYNLSQIHKFRN
jgi:hypothetical protein